MNVFYGYMKTFFAKLVCITELHGRTITACIVVIIMTEKETNELQNYKEKDAMRTKEHNILTQENRDLTAENAMLKKLLKKLTWVSCEKDNMEFKCVTTCWVIDEIRAVLTPDLPAHSKLPPPLTSQEKPS